MRRSKEIVMLLLTVVWLPATSHAFLQHLGLIHQVHENGHHTHSGASHHPAGNAHHEHNAENHAAADGLCLLTLGKFQMPAPAAATPPGSPVAAMLAPLVEPARGRSPSALSPPGLAPPELQQCWQFFFRAAPLSRAPSLAS